MISPSRNPFPFQFLSFFFWRVGMEAVILPVWWISMRIAPKKAVSACLKLIYSCLVGAVATKYWFQPKIKATLSPLVPCTLYPIWGKLRQWSFDFSGWLSTVHFTAAFRNSVLVLVCQAKLELDSKLVVSRVFCFHGLHVRQNAVRINILLIFPLVNKVT